MTIDFVEVAILVFLIFAVGRLGGIIERLDKMRKDAGAEREREIFALELEFMKARDATVLKLIACRLGKLHAQWWLELNHAYSKDPDQMRELKDRVLRWSHEAGGETAVNFKDLERSIRHIIAKLETIRDQLTGTKR